MRKKFSLLLLLILVSQFFLSPIVLRTARGDIFIDIEDAVDNDSSDVDTSPDLGSSSNFTAQRFGPDSEFDTLSEVYDGGLILDYVDVDSSDVDGSSDKGSHSNFDNQKALDGTYDSISEGGSFVASVEELAIDLSTIATSNTATLTEALDTTQVVPFATRYVPTAGGTIDNHESTLIDISISGSTVTASRFEADSKQVNTSIYCVEYTSSINVYSGTFSIGSGSATGTANIGATISLTKGFLVFYYQASGTGNIHSDNAVRGYFSSTTQMTFSRASTTGSISGHWWVVEDTGFNFDVNAVDVTLTGASNTGTFGAVDMNKTMVVGSYSGGWNDDTHYGAVSMYLSSTTEVTVLRGGTTGTIASTVYVIEFHDDTSVQRGEISFSGSQTSLTDNIASVTLGDSMAWIPSGWINTGHCTTMGTGSSDNLDVMIRARLTSDTEITGERNNNGNNDAVLHWEVVEWSIGTPYQLDLEVQWNAIADFIQYDELAIYAGSFTGSEDIGVDCWDESGSQWVNLGNLTASSWNNFTVGTYLTSSNFTVRFKGTDETIDSTQDTWQIDASLVRLIGSGSSEDAVDNDVSDVDSNPDVGTLSNFNNMKDPGLGDATLTEEPAPIFVKLVGSMESESATGASAHNFDYNLQNGAGNRRLVVVTVGWEDAEATASVTSITFDGVDMAEVATVVTGTGYSAFSGLWYLNETYLPSTTGLKNIAVTVSETITREIYVAVVEYINVAQEAPDDNGTYANPSAGDVAVTVTVNDDDSIIVASAAQSGNSVWTNTNNLVNIQEELLTSSGAALGHHTNATSGDTTVGWNSLGTRECMVAAVWSVAPAITDYDLDQEVQWTDLPYNLPNEELSILVGSTDAEDLRVEVWNTTTLGWDTLFSDLTQSSWNNVSIADWLTSGTLTIRFKGGDESSDSTQDQWMIDAALVHIWSSYVAAYKLDLEVQWTSVDSSQNNEYLCINGGTMGSEDVLVDVRQGSTWYNVFSDLSPGWNNVSVASYLDSPTFTIRYRGASETTDQSQDTWQIDTVLLHTWTNTYERASEESLEIIASILLKFPRAIAQSLSVQANAIRTLIGERLVSLPVNILAQTIRGGTFYRSAASKLLVSAIAQATRLVTRIAQETLTILTTGSRTRLIERLPSQVLTLQAIADSTVSLSKSAAQSVRVLTQATRQWSLFRTISQSVQLLTQATHQWTAVRQASQPLQISAAVAKQWTSVRQTSQALILKALATST